MTSTSSEKILSARWGFVQQTDSAVVHHRQESQPIILCFPRDATNSPSTRVPWQTERTLCTGQNWPNKRRDMTVRRVKAAAARFLFPSVPAQGGSKAQVEQYTWICRAKDKMAEGSSAKKNPVNVHIVFCGRLETMFSVVKSASCSSVRIQLVRRRAELAPRPG